MNILQEADQIVNGDRARAYGHPSVNHKCTADLWTAFLVRKYGINFNMSAEDVCWLNILQKISREANMEKRDNRLDVIGYAVNVEMISDSKRSRKRSRKR